MKTLISTFIFITFFALILNAQTSMAKVAKTKSESINAKRNNEINYKNNFKTIKLSALSEATYDLNYVPKKYTRFTYIFDSDDPKFIALVEKNFYAFHLDVVSYNSLFDPNQEYSEVEINEIFEKNGIEAIFVIGYNQGFIDKDPTLYTAKDNDGESQIMYTLLNDEYAVTLYTCIYDLERGSVPFIKVRAESRTHVKWNIPDLVNKDMIYTLEGLKKHHLLIPNIEKKKKKK